MNALALAIFLGLAASAKESSTFGFLLLDDRSQSLGSEHKRELARLLDKVAQHRRLIVATMDTEFDECLSEGLTKAKKEYRFGDWTLEEGPSITTVETASDDAPSSGRSANRRHQLARR